ncbi:MAG TPA: prephenate dehydratase [Methanomicrobia archaeon]|nr:prephenate dehydratase [Methanomicrobia archaeon]
MKLGLLGPEGTFSETAALLWLKTRTKTAAEPAELLFYPTIFDVADSVARGEVGYGVVPIENSLEGSVGETLDVLTSESTAGSVQIAGEVLVPIKICLLARGAFDQIRTVVSHPHAIAQCKRFIRGRLLSRGVKVQAVDSTAAAAKLARELDAIAALASEEAARKYQLTILMEDVQDMASVTRFVALAPAAVQTAPTGHDKTSLLLALKDRPGALYDVLGVFAERGINLTKIESRPSRRALGDYMFHIDCEGHVEEKEIKAVLANLESRVTLIKLLGSYPRAE